jgi:hypothetical protein
VEDVNNAVQAAKTAQPEWAKTSFAERRKVLRTLLKYGPLQCNYYHAMDNNADCLPLLDTSSITKTTS